MCQIDSFMCIDWIVIIAVLSIMGALILSFFVGGGDE